MKMWRWGSALSRLAAVLALTVPLSLAGCGGDGDGGDDGAGFQAATPADLADKSFPFGADSGIFAEDDPLAGQGAVLTVGSFDGDTAAFALVSDDGSVLAGTVTLGSCIVTTAFVALAGGETEVLEPDDPDAVDVLDPCEVNEGDGSFRFVDEDGVEVVSGPSSDAAVVAAFDFTVPLSPAYEVEPAASLADRPESGTASLQLLSGNVLSYSVSVTNLLSGDGLTAAHIHRGSAVENGGVVVSLVGGPGEPASGRFAETLPQFDGGAAVSGSTVLLPSEAADLTTAPSDFYVNVHSEDVPAGLLRGQIDREVVLAFNTALSPADVVDPATPLDTRTETGFSTFRLFADDTLSFNLKVDDLAASDELTNAHIHRGGSEENGPIFITLVGAPDQAGQEGRQEGIAFEAQNGTLGAVGNFGLSGAEVANLTDPAQGFYAQIHSQEVPAGLLRGRLREMSANVAPTADAGGNQTVTEGDDVTLDGAGSSDDDGTIEAFAWAQTGGTPSATLDGADTATATFTAPEVEASVTLTFTLTVTDDGGLEDSDEVMVTVQDSEPSNLPPTADAGDPRTADEGTAVTLDGSASFDDDGTIEGFSWVQTGGTPTVDVTGADTATPSFTAPDVDADATLTFTLTVTDDGGLMDTATVEVTVLDVPVPAGDPIEGGILFTTFPGFTCGTSFCHGPDGNSGSAPDLQGFSAAQLQGNPHGESLTAQEAADIEAFLGQQFVSFAEQIQPIYTANCLSNASCHVGSLPAQGLNLEAGNAYDEIVGVPATEAPSLNRVEPFDSASSFLFQKHTGEASVGARMPFDNPTFFDDNPDLLELERLWIDQGALDN